MQPKAARLFSKLKLPSVARFVATTLATGVTKAARMTGVDFDHEAVNTIHDAKAKLEAEAAKEAETEAKVAAALKSHET
jgi:hypothetical protein